MYIIQELRRLCRIFVLATALEDEDPRHQACLDTPDVARVQSICHLFVQEKILFLEECILALLVANLVTHGRELIVRQVIMDQCR